MLTEAELRWVEETGHLCKRCEWCQWDNPCIRYGRLGMEESCPGSSPRNLEHDFRDAAEFESRVAAYIAFWSQIMPCPTRAGCKAQSILECAACWLKHARIVIEEEMERETPAQRGGSGPMSSQR